MSDSHCHNCGIPLDYNKEFGWVLYVEGPRRLVYLNYCPNCGFRLDKTPEKAAKTAHPDKWPARCLWCERPSHGNTGLCPEHLSELIEAF